MVKKEEKTQIFFARHSQSIHNLNKVHNSEPENDKGLSATGKRWTRELANRLRGGKIDLIYSSHMPRCVQTASIVAKVLRKKVNLDKRFREPLMGKYELMTEAQIKRKYPKAARILFFGDVTNLKLGERFKDAQRRVWNAMQAVAKKHNGKRILIVTHQAPIKFIICKLFGGLKHFNKFSLHNASLTLIVKQGKNYKLRYLNDTSHIQ